jgi:hypothetical protein
VVSLLCLFGFDPVVSAFKPVFYLIVLNIVRQNEPNEVMCKEQ